jgi:predicted DNA-binding ribbon-helix-helix protein
MSSGWLRPPRRDNDNSLSTLVIRNIVVAGHRTSVRLEPAMWEALRDIGRRLGLTIHDLVTQIDRDRTASSLTAAIRVYIVDFYRAAFLGQRVIEVEPISVRLRGDC